MFIFQLVEVCHQYSKHKTDIIKICNALFVIFHQYKKFGENIMCRHVPIVPCGSYAPVSAMYTVCEYHIMIIYIYIADVVTDLFYF